MNVTAFIGKDYGVGVWTSHDIIKRLADRCKAERVEGFTVSEAFGYWVNPNSGKAECENTLRVEFLAIELETAERILQALCRSLMQWEIVYTVDGQGCYRVQYDPTTDRAMASRSA